MAKIRAVVFDADGTLIDSPNLIIAAHQHVAAVNGLPTPEKAAILEHMGKSIRDVCLGLFPDYDPEILVRESTSYVSERAHTAPLHDGLHELLNNLGARGVKLSIMTSGNHKIHETLQHHQIEDKFASVVHCDRVARQKPDSEGVLLALQECDVKPESAVMIGDMRYDILAGKNAGVAATVGLTHGFGTEEELEAAGADYVIHSLLAIEGVIDMIEADGS